MIFENEYLTYMLACALTMPVCWCLFKLLDNWNNSWRKPLVVKDLGQAGEPPRAVTPLLPRTYDEYHFTYPAQPMITESFFAR